MAGGATVAPHRTEADQKSCKHQHCRAGLDRLCREPSGGNQANEGCGDQAGNEGEPPGKFAILVGRQQACGDAADAGNAPGDGHQHDGGSSDQRASEGGCDRREGSDRHSTNLRFRVNVMAVWRLLLIAVSQRTLHETGVRIRNYIMSAPAECGC